jgi:uncharacterized protein DUF6680
MTPETLGLLTLVAIAVSPVIAVLVTVWLADRKEAREHKVWLLRTLIGTRHNPTGDETIRALNLIDVVFHDAPRVRALWHEYYDMLNNAGLNNPVGWEQWNKKNLELVTEMAQTLGYGRAITHLDAARVYTPVALGEQTRKNAALVDGFLDLFKRLGGGPPPAPPDEPTE